MGSSPHFSLTCFKILSWKFAYDFVLMYYRSSLIVVSLHPSGSPSVHPFSALASYMNWPLSWFFLIRLWRPYSVLLENFYLKRLSKWTWLAYYALFAVLRYIWHFIWYEGFCHRTEWDLFPFLTKLWMLFNLYTLMALYIIYVTAFRIRTDLACLKVVCVWNLRKQTIDSKHQYHL